MGPNVVLKLCGFIKNLCESKKPQPLHELMIVRAFYALSEWIVFEPINPWFLTTSRSVLKSVFEVIEVGFKFSKSTDDAAVAAAREKARKVSKTISGEYSPYLPSGINNSKEAANFLLRNIMKLGLVSESGKKKKNKAFVCEENLTFV